MITSSYFNALTRGRSRPRPRIRTPRPFEATTSNPTSQAVWGRDLKSDLYAHLWLFEAAVLNPTSKGWGGRVERALCVGVKASVASLRGVGKRSELTAGGLASSLWRRGIASLSYIPTVQCSTVRNATDPFHTLQNIEKAWNLRK